MQQDPTICMSQLYRLYFHSYKHHHTLEFPRPHSTIPSPIVNDSFPSFPLFMPPVVFPLFFSLLDPLHLVLSKSCDTETLIFHVYPKELCFFYAKIVFIFCVTAFSPFIPPPSLLFNRHSPSPPGKYFVLALQSLSDYSILFFFLLKELTMLPSQKLQQGEDAHCFWRNNAKSH